jgi:hypothetical protein
MDIPTSFIWIIIYVERAFEYDEGAKFWGCVGSNAERLCLELCNFVQFCVFVK